MLLANDSGNCMAGVPMAASDCRHRNDWRPKCQTLPLTLVAAAIGASLNCRVLASPNILILIGTLWFLSRW